MANNNALIRKKLWDKGIHSFILWNPLHNDVEKNENKVSKYLSDSIVILPVNHDLDIKDIDRIVEVINE
jgi:dTDP-4-amino-4,6-dideoxygalactose transaminase